ncbi:MAG: hypothetical protein ACRC3H_05365 [Lachnospiraceae bacterium]
MCKKTDGLDLFIRNIYFVCNCGAHMDIKNSKLICPSCGYAVEVVDADIYPNDNNNVDDDVFNDIDIRADDDSDFDDDNENYDDSAFDDYDGYDDYDNDYH